MSRGPDALQDRTSQYLRTCWGTDWDRMSSLDGIANSGGWVGSASAPVTAINAPAASPTATRPPSFADAFATAFQRNIATIFDPQATAPPAQPTAAAGSLGAATGAAIAQRKDVVNERLSNSVERMQEVSTKLDSEYPLADTLKSASTGTWDPATFKPRTEQEARAFAERMATDMTEAAARLDIVKNELDGARLDAQTSNTSGARAKVENLTRESSRQMQYLAKLATIVDSASGGTTQEVGEDALKGDSSRVYTDVSTRELANEMRRMGFATTDIERMLGAGEMSIGEQKTPGGDKRLRTSVDAMTAKFCQGILDDWSKRIDRDTKRLHEFAQRADRDRQTKRTTEKQRDVQRHEMQVTEQHQQQFEALVAAANAHAQQQSRDMNQLRAG